MAKLSCFNELFDVFRHSSVDCEKLFMRNVTQQGGSFLGGIFKYTTLCFACFLVPMLSWKLISLSKCFKCWKLSEKLLEIHS